MKLSISSAGTTALKMNLKKVTWPSCQIRGSTDGSYELAESLGITVYKKTYESWRFDTARNDLREMLPDVDAWVLSLDVDEVLTPGWREHMKAVPMDVNRPRYDYVWNFKKYVLNEDETVNYKATIDSGEFGVSYHADKIVRRHSHVWRRNCPRSQPCSKRRASRLD